MCCRVVCNDWWPVYIKPIRLPIYEQGKSSPNGPCHLRLWFHKTKLLTCTPGIRYAPNREDTRNNDPLEYAGCKFSLEKCAQIFKMPSKAARSQVCIRNQCTPRKSRVPWTQGRWQQPRCGLDGVKCDKSPWIVDQITNYHLINYLVRFVLHKMFHRYKISYT